MNKRMIEAVKQFLERMWRARQLKQKDTLIFLAFFFPLSSSPGDPNPKALFRSDHQLPVASK